MNLFEFRTALSELANESDITKKIEKYDKLISDASSHFMEVPKPEPQPNNFTEPNFIIDDKTQKHTDEEFATLQRYYEEQKKQLDTISGELEKVKTAYSDRFNFNKTNEIEKPDSSEVNKIENLFDYGGN